MYRICYYNESVSIDRFFNNHLDSQLTEDYLMKEKDFWKEVFEYACFLVALALFFLVLVTLFITTRSIFLYIIPLGFHPGFVIGELPSFGIMITSVVLSLWMVLKMVASIIVACDVIEKIEVGEDKKNKDVKNKDEKTQSIEIEDVRIEE